MAKSIKELLGSLHEKTREDDLKKWCSELCEFYKENDRHSYSEITEFILSGDGGLDYVYETIPILKQVQKYFEDLGDIDIYKRVKKLIDHLQLEAIRLNYIGDSISDAVQEQFIELNNLHIQQINSLRSESEEKLVEAQILNEEMKTQLQENRKLLEESNVQHTAVTDALAETRRKLSTVQKTAAKAENKVKNAERDSITILGIFAAIVLAFTGGMVFSSSVLENLHNSSIYNLVIVSLCIGIVLFNVMGILLYSLRQIQDSDKKSEYRIYAAGNVILLVLLAITVIGRTNSMEQSVQRQKLSLEQM